MRTIPVSAYAHAFIKAVADAPTHETAPAIRRFIELIRKRGDWPRREQIMKACETTWRAEHHRPLLTIESARPLTAEHRAALTRHAFADRSGDVKHTEPYAKDIEERVNTELVAGVRLTLGDRELDGSLAHLLHRLFQLN